MAARLTVVVSQGQSANPAKRKLEEDLVAALLFESGIEVTVVPHLYDLEPEGSGILCLQGITGNVVVLSWLYPRAAHWVLDRNGITGRVGDTLLQIEDDEEEEDDDGEAETPSEDGHSDTEDSTAADSASAPPTTGRRIYCISLAARDQAADYVEEIKRISRENTVKTVDLLGWIEGNPRPDQMQRYLSPTSDTASNGNGLPIGGDSVSGAPHSTNGNRGSTNGNAPPAGTKSNEAPMTPASGERSDVPTSGASGESGADATPAVVKHVSEETNRRWYPVIDFDRCTNCMECIDFCLFGVYGVSGAEQILVEQPDNCRKGCPACSRVCPENAIMFPQHKSPGIAGALNEAIAGGLKIDLSKLFGAPDDLVTAVEERDRELTAVGRDAVGMTQGIPKRQHNRDTSDKDELDGLMDSLDELDL
jgi:NAD-dependent dihydropyrimidine dehydrogenase PreA subunit